MENLETNEQLSAYLDGELTNAERAALEAQLADDGELRAQLETLQEAVSFLKTHGPVRAPDDLFDAVMAAVDDEPMPSASSWWDVLKKPFGISLGGLAVAAAAVAVLLVALDEGDQAGPAGKVGIDVPASSRSTAKDELAAEPDQAADEWDKNQQDAVADIGLDEEGEEELSAPAPMAKPAPSPLPTKGAPEGTADDAVIDEPKAAPAPSTKGGTPDVEWVQVPFSFVIQTSDPDVLLRLQRLAGRYQGRVVDGSKKPVKTTDLTSFSDDGGYSDFYVELPGTAINAFEDELNTLGVVRRYDSDQGLYPADEATLRVGIQFGDRSQKKLRSQPAYDAFEAPAEDK